MKKQLKPVLLVGGLLIVLLTAIVQSNAAPSAPQPTALPRITATLPPPTETPYASPTPMGKRPPQCTFPLPQTTFEEPIPQEYAFSEPKVVLTSNTTIGIVEWLPDSQRVLITKDFQDENRQTIEVFNPMTGERQVYAERTRIDSPPVWSEELNAVIYPDSQVLKVTRRSGTLPLIEFRRQLWLSQGNPQNAQSIEDVLLTSNFLSYISVGLEPQTRNILYFIPDEKGFIKQNRLSGEKQLLALNLAQWEYRSNGRTFPIPYSMAWRPNTTQVFLYTLGDVGGYTFLLNIANEQLCEIDFGGWADIARWSPNGRYLAIIRTWGSRPVNRSDLAVLDTKTGELYTSQIIPDGMEGLHFVNDVAWAPDNQHLAAITQTLVRDQATQKYYKLSNLYYIDFLYDKVVQIPSSENLGAGLGVPNLIWAGNGSQLLIKCPTDQMDRVCLFTVQESDDE